MSTNQIVIIHNVTVVMFVCLLVGLSTCSVDEIEQSESNRTNSTNFRLKTIEQTINQLANRNENSTLKVSGDSHLTTSSYNQTTHEFSSFVKLKERPHSSIDYRLADVSTPISINNRNRAKRSTTANYRLDYKTKFKNQKFKIYHTSSTTTSSAKNHHLDNQLALGRDILTNDLNDAEITYFTRLTTLNKLQTDRIENDGRAITLRPNISKTSFSSFTLPNYEKENKNPFENVYNIYPNGFYTSKAHDLYTETDFRTNYRAGVKTTKSSKNRFNRKSSVLENTATSLIPLLLFDRHQLAQEINFTARNLSTPSPTVDHRNHNARTYTPHHSFYTTNHHKSHTGHHTTKSPRNLDRTRNSNYHSGDERHTVKFIDKNIDKKGNNVHFQAKLNQSENKEKDKRLPVMNIVRPRIIEMNENSFNDKKNEFSLTTKPVLLDDWSKPEVRNNQGRQLINLVNIDYDSKLSYQSTTHPLPGDKSTEHYRFGINSNENKMTTRFDLMQNDGDRLSVEVIKIPQISSSKHYFNNLSNGSLGNVSSTDDSYSILSPAVQNLVTISLCLVIIITVIGNTLVCLSPIYFRKLRHPSNYLLISLALSDLGVALLVMPIALYKELHDVWSLGTLICDVFLGLDVTCCTASILHLCVICIDRYLTITRPFTYAVRRKSSRSLILISIVWTLAIVVCLPPLLVLGNEHGTKEQPICDYCNDFFYQLYATLGAFYIPLLVMLVLYYKIYEAAKKVIEAEHKSQCSLSAANAGGHLKSCNPSSYMKQMNNTCPAHPNSLTLSNEKQFANNVNNVEKSIDQRSQPKQAALEKSSSTNCSSCGQPLEQQQHTSKANNRTDNSSNDDQNGSATRSNKDVNSSKNASNDKFKRRKCLFTLRKSKSKENSVISNFDEECLKCENDHSKDYTNNEECHKKDKSKNKKTKKKIRSPDVKHSNKMANQPLLEQTRTKQCTDHNLEFIDQIDQVDTSDLCEQCLSEMMMSNSNDTNNNLNNGDMSNDLPTVLECNLDQTFNQLNKHRTSRNCKIECEKFVQSNQFEHKAILAETKTPEQLKNRSINLNVAHQQISSQSSNRKITNSSLRERKASITLGVIMCAFIFCWLPFFILALLRPFAAQLVPIPDWASSLTLWLGYFNSCANPIIYVTFHQDFRRAFKYILLCRCKVMKSSMRKEAYNVQYG